MICNAEAQQTVMICNAMTIMTTMVCNYRTNEDPFGLYLRVANWLYMIHGLKPNTKSTMYLEAAIRSSHRYMKLLKALLNIVLSKLECQLGSATPEAQTIAQPITITDEEVDNIANEFTSLWLSPFPVNYRSPGAYTCLRNRRSQTYVTYLFSFVIDV